MWKDKNHIFFFLSNNYANSIWNNCAVTFQSKISNNRWFKLRFHIFQRLNHNFVFWSQIFFIDLKSTIIASELYCHNSLKKLLFSNCSTMCNRLLFQHSKKEKKIESKCFFLFLLRSSLSKLPAHEISSIDCSQSPSDVYYAL